MSFVGFLGDVASSVGRAAVGAATQAVGQALNPLLGPMQVPGRAFVPAAVGSVAAGAQQVSQLFPQTLAPGPSVAQRVETATGVNIPFIGFDPAQVDIGGAGAIAEVPYRVTEKGNAVAQPFVTRNPVSGRTMWFGPYGMPKDWSLVEKRKPKSRAVSHSHKHKHKSKKKAGVHHHHGDSSHDRPRDARGRFL